MIEKMIGLLRLRWLLGRRVRMDVEHLLSLGWQRLLNVFVGGDVTGLGTHQTIMEIGMLVGIVGESQEAVEIRVGKLKALLETLLD